MQRWLEKNWIGLVTLFISGLYLYLQIREWKKHGDDFGSATFVVVVTAILWVLLAIAIGLYVKNTMGIHQRIPDIEKAGVLKSYAGQADWLAKRLEEIWTQYTEEKKVMPNPLGLRAMPDDIKEWSDKKLFEFRILYRAHIDALKKTDPECKSDLITDGFPCEGQDYLTVKRKIEAHATFLRQQAATLHH
jgi:hypothetical protein